MEHNNDTFSESFDLSTGFHDHTAKIKISPWPFIATGTLATISVTLTPGKLITELKRIITWFRNNACSDWSEIYCTFTCNPRKRNIFPPYHPYGATQGEFLKFHFLKTFGWEKTKRTLERQKQRQMLHYFSMSKSFI